MSAYATFFPADRERDGWDARIEIHGAMYVYSATRTPSVRRRWEPSVDAFLDQIRDATLDVWNTMSEVAEQDGRRYLLYFRLVARRGTSMMIQQYVDREQYTLIERECIDDNYNVIVMANRIRRGAWGSVPPHSPDHEPEFHTRRHQPYGDVMLLTKNHVLHVAAHEIGHLLGLGEGYADYGIYRMVRGERILAHVERRTIPGHSGTPMALEGDAGRTLNESQREALLGYCLAARAAARSAGVAGRQYGPRVRGYRAREEGATP